MIKAIVFDFDGVLVESVQIKTDAFRKLFSKWQDKVEEIVAYHIRNMGISRYVKFKYFYENILNEPYSEEIGMELGERFSEIVLNEIKIAPFVKGAEEFLSEKYQKYLLFIASGTPQEELNDIISCRGMSKFFKDIFGASATKKEIVGKILDKYNLERDEVVFVGDAESDIRAARDTGIRFILRLAPDNESLINYNGHRIYDLTQLENKIEETK